MKKIICIMMACYITFGVSCKDDVKDAVPKVYPTIHLEFKDGIC